MLSVASVHHPETPGSASKHSSLGHYSERPTLKRRKSRQESCASHKKVFVSSSNEIPYSEITVQVIHQKNATPKTFDNPSDITALLQNTVISASVPAKETTEESFEQKVRKACQQITYKSDKPIVISVSSDSEKIQITKLDETTELTKATIEHDKAVDKNVKDHSPNVSQIAPKSNRKVVTTDEIFSNNGLFQSAVLSKQKIEEKSVTPIKASVSGSEISTLSGPENKNATMLHDVTSTEVCIKKPLKISSRLERAAEQLKNVRTNSTAVYCSKPSENIRPDFLFENKQSTDEKLILTTTAEESRSLEFPRKCRSNVEVEDESNNFQKSQYYEDATNNDQISSSLFQTISSQNESEADWDVPYYTMGFPNPPGENRCWLNATLHALFALPFIKHLDSITLLQASNLLEALVKLQTFWRLGSSEKSKINQCLKMFKLELGVLDESYPSERQQDVSEFLMIFLNYIKTYFDKVAKNSFNEEIENVPKNQQDSSRRAQTQLDSSKRQPLADISSAAGQLRICQKLTDNNQVMKMTLPMSDSSGDESDSTCNPIDEFFLLHMVENYICDGCSKKRSKKIDNMMLYVDLPSENVSTIDLTESIKKTCDVEHRNLTCESCKHDTHSIETKFRKAPKILMVQINRYGITSSGEMNKICTAVEIPKVLKLNSSVISEDVDNETEYEPISIISHVGSAMDCGHYTSYVKYGEDWYYYNDMHVSPMTSQDALESTQTTAYVVFFRDMKLNDNC